MAQKLEVVEEASCFIFGFKLGRSSTKEPPCSSIGLSATLDPTANAKIFSLIFGNYPLVRASLTPRQEMAISTLNPLQSYYLDRA